MTMFPKYESYKDSGIEWIGEIPAHWEVKRGKYIFYEVDERSKTGDEELLSVSHMTGITPRSEKNVSMFMAENYIGSKLCQKGDLVFNIMWAWMGALGVSDRIGIVSPSYGVYRQQKQGTFNPRYLEHLLQSQEYVAEYNRRSTGLHSSRLRLYAHMFFDMEINIPPREDQDRIVSFLDEKTREIDDAIAKKQRLIELLQEQKAILINNAVTKGLERDVPMKESGVAWIGRIPAHWEVKKLKYISTFVTSGPRGWAEYYSDDGSYFLQSGNLNDSVGIDLEKAHKVNPPSGSEGVRTRLRNEDVLICITGANTGRVAIAHIDNREVYINQHLCLVRSAKEVYPLYLAYCLFSNVGKKHFFLSQYGLKEGLGLDDIKNTSVLIPPFQEQRSIAHHVQSIMMESDFAEREIKTHIIKLKKLKAVLIAEAVTGKIKV